MSPIESVSISMGIVLTMALIELQSIGAVKTSSSTESPTLSSRCLLSMNPAVTLVTPGAPASSTISRSCASRRARSFGVCVSAAHPAVERTTIASMGSEARVKGFNFNSSLSGHLPVLVVHSYRFAANSASLQSTISLPRGSSTRGTSSSSRSVRAFVGDESIEENLRSSSPTWKGTRNTSARIVWHRADALKVLLST